MRLDDLDYDLPAAAIAQEPPARREDARLLELARADGGFAHSRVFDLPRRLRSGDLLVANDTRVIPARLFARRETGGRVELLLIEPDPDHPGGWLALARAGGRLREGEALALGQGRGLRLAAALERGRWRVVGIEEDIAVLMARFGRMPLPPYIQRTADDPRDALDRDRYQTIFARHEGAVAAPTAGLHLTSGLVRALAAAGVETAFVTLHVGLGTFEPVRTETLETHTMHEERFTVPVSTARALEGVRARGGRVVAVGTTTVRALEAHARGEAGRTRLLIAPGHEFGVVDALLTNFHLPRSTLLALVAAFAGLEPVLAAYREALRAGYRFYSYGDAMLIQ
jgi:S-adenosylmethionine:tRNA ribosyltransferase-isomerase